MLKRFLDLFLILFSLPVTLPLALITYLIVKATSEGKTIYWSKRVGIQNQLFNMPKFRSMKINTPALATHIMNQQADPKQYLTPVGSIIRKTSLDELPQLWSVFKGDMSIVGPRPALFNQDDLIHLRTENGVHQLKPGITGWAQVNGRDELPIPQKVVLDTYYLKHQSFWLDCYIILLTIIKVIKRDGVSH
ncbi:MAG: lipid carrier--UDP-N-acetylgalactosaminyltransferase [Methylophilales bacterium 16-45-7]|nr:MAG: lipid carrier--UDP-N-acetylgalactosaminyltransferase [Methylophilales bacterium 16-45-7]